VVWNLWGGGGRDYVMKVYGDGTMTFPFQAIQYGDFSAYEQNGMTFGDIMYNWGGDYMSQADTRGTASPAEIAWDKTYVATPVYKNGTTYPGYYGVGYEFTANKLNFTDGSSFLIGKTANPVVTYEVTDDAVVVGVGTKGVAGAYPMARIEAMLGFEGVLLLKGRLRRCLRRQECHKRQQERYDGQEGFHFVDCRVFGFVWWWEG
jgi:hypothetical protein